MILCCSVVLVLQARDSCFTDLADLRARPPTAGKERRASLTRDRPQTTCLLTDDDWIYIYSYLHTPVSIIINYYYTNNEDTDPHIVKSSGPYCFLASRVWNQLGNSETRRRGPRAGDRSCARHFSGGVGMQPPTCLCTEWHPRPRQKRHKNQYGIQNCRKLTVLETPPCPKDTLLISYFPQGRVERLSCGIF